MRKELNNFNVKELSYKEIRHINGGGAVWYWFGQVCGYIASAVIAVNNAWTSTPEGHATQQALRDFQ